MRLSCAVLAASLCLTAQPARAGSGELWPAFDGGSRGTSLDLKALRLAGVQSVSGKQGEVPADIIEAAKTWGTAAQCSKLEASNPEAKETFSFAVLGDIELGRFPWQRVFAPKGAFGKLMALIHAGSPDLIVQLGDFVSKGTVKNYREYVSLIGKTVSLPMLTVIGNHDRRQTNGTNGDRTLYRALFGDTDFFYDYNGWRFIGLDTSDHKLRPAQLEWLARTLKPGGRSLIFTHVPPDYLKNRVLVHEPEVEKQGYNMSGYFKEGSREFEALITAAGVRRVYMGHIHAYGTAERRGVRYVLSGGGGSPLYPLPPGYPKMRLAHFVLVTLGPSGIAERVFKADGSELPARAEAPEKVPEVPR